MNPLDHKITVMVVDGSSLGTTLLWLVWQSDTHYVWRAPSVCTLQWSSHTVPHVSSSEACIIFFFLKLYFAFWILSILTACRLHWHHLFSTDRHIQYPMLHSRRYSHFVIPSTPFLIYSRHYPTLIGLALTTSGEPQLSAYYTGITCVPVVITHCSPCFIEADLNSSLVRHCAFYQPDITITADYDTKLHHIINFIYVHSQYNVCLLTFRLATDTCVFIVGAVTSVLVISTVNQSAFRSSTLHIIQKALTTPPTKMSIWKGRRIFVHQKNKWSMHNF